MLDVLVNQQQSEKYESLLWLGFRKSNTQKNFIFFFRDRSLNTIFMYIEKIKFLFYFNPTIFVMKLKT